MNVQTLITKLTEIEETLSQSNRPQHKGIYFRDAQAARALREELQKFAQPWGSVDANKVASVPE